MWRDQKKKQFKFEIKVFLARSANRKMPTESICFKGP